MKIIKNQISFLEWLKAPSENWLKTFISKNQYHVNDMLLLDNIDIKDIDIKYKNFISTKFTNCNFENCEIVDSVFSCCEFMNCIFYNCQINSTKFCECDLTKTKFENCTVFELELSDVDIDNSLFINCLDIDYLRIVSYNSKRKISFKNCYISYLYLVPNTKEISEIYNFKECIISESNFYTIDLRHSSFVNCTLSSNQFCSCILSKNTLHISNNAPASEFNFIDLRTILNSDKQSNIIVENIFGINNNEIKEYIYGLTSKIEFQSIFISYSFKDKYIANKINNELTRKGILTFLWEKDAPAGKDLEHIMSKNVKAQDRVLFIASRDSLRSKACQYELSEGRKKQEEIWENVLFPIHIDNYLFEIEKHDIRPIECQDEFWENICELRRVNSLDFSSIIENSNQNNIDFNGLVYKLIKGLRKEK